MRSEMNLNLQTEIRHLPPDVIQQLSNWLDENGFWRVLATKIPYSSTDSSALYGPQHLHIMEISRDGPTKTFLRDWGVHGRKRPTVGSFIQLLIDCEVYKIADYLSVDILKGDPVPKNFNSTTSELRQLSLDQKSEREPHQLPDENAGQFAQPAQINYHQFIDDSLPHNSETAIGVYSNPINSDISDRPITVTHSKTSSSEHTFKVPQWSYEYLRNSTNNFNEIKFKDGGRRLGSGAFSDVFLSIHGECRVAVKRTKKEFEFEFNKEVNILSSLRHKNFIKLIAVSFGDPYLCLIYEFMTNGSLHDRLARVNNSPSILWKTRLQIAADIAEGLVCLHSHGFVHRDIKSANILLDNRWVAKLGDFGIAHVGPDLSMDTSLETIRIMGTTVYMPKEAFHGIVTFKFDTYSFGVVVLELLTGMKPCDPLTKDDLVNYVAVKCSESNDIKMLLDSLAGHWDVDLANEVYHLTKKCLEFSQTLRPTMNEVVYKFQTYALNARQMTV